VADSNPPAVSGDAEVRQQLLRIYQAALTAVEGRAAVRHYLTQHPIAGSWHLVAIGKAAASMVQGAVEQLGDTAVGGLVITKHGHSEGYRFDSSIRIIEAGHPTPDAATLEAGEALLDYLDSAAEDAQFLFLISGGASSLVEVLPDGVGLESLQRLNRWLLSSGLDISHMNQLRKRLSLIKGGRLAAWLKGRRTELLAISDVPGDDLSVVGSGLLVADRTTVAAPLPETLPDWLREWGDRAGPPPEPEARCFQAITLHLIATNRDVRQAATAAAEMEGLPVVDHTELLVGGVESAAESISDTLMSEPPALHIWGGETTVKLPANPGRGGRCQQLALLVAESIAGRAGYYLLAAGSDGSDGPGTDAGALVDGGSRVRGEDGGFDLGHALVTADAGSFLEASGDLIETGPTGTNVMDLVMALRLPLERR